MTIPAILALAEELTIQTVAGALTGPPLLQMMREAVGADSGRTRGGAASPSERSLIDAGAFTLFEDITGQIASQFSTATDLRPNRAPEVNLLAWTVVFTAARSRGDVTDLQVEVAHDKVASWANRIRAHFAPPIVKEITAPCPHCFQRYILKDRVDRVAALIATIRPGTDIEVDCGSCHSKWAGDADMVSLGRAIGMVLDVDAIRDARTQVA